MKLFDLYATIGLDSGNFMKGLDSARKFAEKTVSAVVKTTTVAFTAATAAMVGMSKSSLNAMGELEQNMGGSEAVFKQFAATVQAAGKKAYETMGLSQSEYLATANKMAALMQGSGIDIQQSMELTTKAMQRAADVASIMGIDTAWAMESVAGAAKGNFTMMDNLGVAMNATTIEAYALSKGIKTAYAEMDNATKIGLAMEMFLEQSEYAAGNYAKENETLAGSFSTVRAAYQNFLSGAGNARELANALSRAGRVVAKNMKAMIPGLVNGMNELFVSLTPELPALMESILPGVIQGAGSLLRGLGTALPDLAVTLVDSVPQILDEMTTAATHALPALRKSIEGIFAGLPEKLPAIMKEAGELMSTVWGRSVWPVLQDALKVTLGVDLPKWEKVKLELMKRWDESGIGEWAQGAFGNVKSFLEDVSAVLQNIAGWATGEGSEFVEKVTLIAGGITALLSPTLLLTGATVALVTNWDSVKESVSSAFETTVSWLEDNLGTPLENFRTNVIVPLVDRWGEVKESIREAVDNVGDFLGIDLIEGWDKITNSISSAWETVTGWIQTATEALGNFFGVDVGKTSNAPWYVQQHPELYGKEVLPSSFEGSNGVKHGTDGGRVGSFAKGLNFVPYDNFPAYLHYGEAILTAQDAKNWRSGQGESLLIEEIRGLRDAMISYARSPVPIILDGREVGNVLYGDIGRKIHDGDRQAVYGMGG